MGMHPPLPTRAMATQRLLTDAMMPTHLLPAWAKTIRALCHSANGTKNPLEELVEQVGGAQFGGVDLRLGRVITSARGPKKFGGPRMGLGRFAWTRGVVNRRGWRPGTGTSVSHSRTTLNVSRGRGTTRALRPAGPRQRSDWPPCADASPIVLELATSRIKLVGRSAMDQVARTTLRHVASAEKPSTLVSIRLKRVQRCQNPSRRGQLKTKKSTRPSCMGEEFMMQQLAVPRAPRTPAAVTLPLVLARRRAMIDWRV